MGKETWSEQEFWEQFEADPKNSAYREVAERVVQWARPKNLLQWSDKTGKGASFKVRLNHNGKDHRLFGVIANTGRPFGSRGLEIEFKNMHHPFDEGSALRKQLRDKLNAINGIALPDESSKGGQRPAFWLSVLKNERSLDQFLATFEWMIHEIRG